MSDTDREVLFSNESFVVGMLQAVSGGSIVAALSQYQALMQNAGRNGLLWFLTLMTASLIFAILAAYWKHQYKMWDVKAAASLLISRQHRAKDEVSEAELHEAEAKERGKKSNRQLSAMRSCMGLSVLCVVVGLALLVFCLWQAPVVRAA
jgi:hypothetical protein